MAAFAETAIFPATLDACPRIIAYVRARGQDAGVPATRLPHLELAVEEVVVNICRYAYPATPGEVTVRLHAAAGSFRIALTDNGVPFNPLAADEPDIHAALADRKVGGLGIYFIRKVIDEVQYQRVDDRNILTLVMRLGQEGEPCNGSHGIG